MIYKTRTLPKRITGNHALLRRLHPQHEKAAYILEDYKNRKAGFGGEKHFDKQLMEFKPTYPHAILHDICLQTDGVYFQMDSLLITPDTIILFEIKNVAGRIIVTENPQQFIKITPTDKRSVMKSPILELERKEFHLNNWLHQRGYKIPITKIVVFAYLNEFTIESPTNASILLTYEVPTHLRNIQIKNEILTKYQIHQLAQQLIKNHNEYNPFPMIQTLDIKQTDLLPGVFCPNCQLTTMKWHHKKWYCQQCGPIQTAAQAGIFSDWLCLVDNTITNSQFRNFSSIQNQNIAKRMLKNKQLKQIGTRRNAYYVLNPGLLIENEALHDM